MAITQTRPKRKVSGGRYRGFRSKKKYELGRHPINTKIAPKRKTKFIRVLGANKKYKTLTANEINVGDKKGKVSKTAVLNVIENPANPNLVRRNVLTKGAIVETKMGKARITSRPGQDASINAVLV